MANGQSLGDAEQQEWRESAPFWKRHAQTIRAMFAPVTEALIEEAGIVRGGHVLDVAGGPGEPSLSIAKVVGPEGSVTCTDVVSKMVDAAKDEARRQGLVNLRFRQCEAEALPFENASFDATVCRLGAMFFRDPSAALGEMVRVTRAEGSVSLVVWGKSALNPFSSVISSVVSQFVPSPQTTPYAHDAFRFAETGALATILAAAGADDVRERVFRFHIEAPISFDEFWGMRSETSATLRDKLATLPAEMRAQVTSEVREAVKEFFPNNRMKFPAVMLIVTGRQLHV